MDSRIIKVLSNKELPDDVGELLENCKNLVSLSRDAMKDYYDLWEHNDMVYRGERAADVQDRKALKKNEPAKFVMTVSHAQVQTFVSFVLSVFNQRDYFYELQGVGAEDAQAAELAQATLEYNLKHEKFRQQKLRQFATHIAKYGLGVIKHSWTHDTKMEKQQVQTAIPTTTGEPVTIMSEQLVPVTKFMGNSIRIISPFHFFPDPRVPLSKLQDGEFVASEDEYSDTQMGIFQRNGVIAGIEHADKLQADALANRRKFSFQREMMPNSFEIDKKNYIVTEVQLYLNPAKTLIDGQPLDKTKDFDCKYLVWYANDSRIVRIEELDYPHDEWTYDVSQFEEDEDKFVNLSLVELIASLQDVMDWFINARVTNVRKIIANQAIVDPTAIELQDLKNRNPILRLKPQFAGTGVEKYYKQIELRDVTATHLQDVEFLHGYVKNATGLSENLLGQFASGRRSAREAQNVNSNAVARILLLANTIWSASIEPLGRKMLANLREGLDEPTLVRILGTSVTAYNPSGLAAFKNVTKEDLIGDYDFLMLDGTLPSQRAEQAQALQELLALIGQSPENAVIFQYDPQLILQEILQLRGIRNAQRFKIDPAKAGQLISLVQATRNAGVGGGSRGSNTGTSKARAQ